VDPDTYILVAEDDPELLKMLVHLLSSIGEVVTATDGLDAWEKASSGRVPSVIVTDLMMPGMDGLTLSRKLKGESRLAKVPLVMLTARAGARDVIAGINAGARFYVTKPFKNDDFLAKVRKALGQRT
jgi:CheY-like chemotaxis protein